LKEIQNSVETFIQNSVDFFKQIIEQNKKTIKDTLEGFKSNIDQLKTEFQTITEDIGQNKPNILESM